MRHNDNALTHIVRRHAGIIIHNVQHFRNISCMFFCRAQSSTDSISHLNSKAVVVTGIVTIKIFEKTNLFL